MTYAEVTVIINGAIESEEVITDSAILSDYISQVKSEALDDDITMEVYVLYHEHVPMEECMCAQYVTDHHPVWTST
jgi:hypothetical protein